MKTSLAVAALLVLACSSADITTNRDSTVPLPAEPMWAWGRRDTVSHYELDPAAENPTLHSTIQAAIEYNLDHKKWKRVNDPDQADLLVTYHVGLKQSTGYTTTTTAVGGAWWGGYGWGYYGAPTYVVSNTEAITYNQGALLVIVRDRHSGAVAWEGLYRKDVHDPHRVNRDAIQEAVDELLRELR